MKTPNGTLEILREYSCTCIVYRDQSGVEFEENGLMCGLEVCHGPDNEFDHKRALVQGQETQPALF